MIDGWVPEISFVLLNVYYCPLFPHQIPLRGLVIESMEAFSISALRLILREFCFILAIIPQVVGGSSDGQLGCQNNIQGVWQRPWSGQTHRLPTRRVVTGQTNLSLVNLKADCVFCIYKLNLDSPLCTFLSEHSATLLDCITVSLLVPFQPECEVVFHLVECCCSDPGLYIFMAFSKDGCNCRNLCGRNQCRNQS